MFTGLVEEVGSLVKAASAGETMLLTIKAPMIASGVKLGDSVAVNGVCLTVTSFHGQQFTADVMPQTFRFSNLNRLTTGASVNLERAMQLGDRFGGHIVQGHVDGTAIILERKQDGNAVVFRLRLHTRDLQKYMLPQGSICIDGISLTIVNCVEDEVSVSIIPHTLAQTALAKRTAGEMVNIECDVLGKYVAHLLRYGNKHPQDGQDSSSSRKGREEKPISLSYLADNGFF